jgi:membrane-associated phospholipid phosphatase
MEALTSPGWSGGVFYNLVQCAHQAGERPTAAFPSSHVAIAMLVMLITTKLRMWRWLIILAIPFIFLCLSTVYIYAHYAIDAIAGLIFGTLLFFLLGGRQLGSSYR